MFRTSYFPLKIRLCDSEDTLVVKSENAIPKGVPFVVLETSETLPKEFVVPDYFNDPANPPEFIYHGL